MPYKLFGLVLYVMPRSIPNERLIENLKQFAQELGETPTRAEMREQGPHNPKTYRRNFGSWNDALAKAGLEPNHTQTDYSDAEWSSESKLRELYQEKELSTYEIGERYDVTPATVYHWLKKRGIETRTNGEYSKNAKHRDENWLRKMHHEQHHSILKIAEAADVSTSTIEWNMERFGIETRQYEAPPVRTTKEGYARVRSGNQTGGTTSVKVHQLVAIADGADPYEVFGGSNHIHHKNGIPFDNRPSNLELLSAGEHVNRHLNNDDFWT